jgi:hypothetical protein
MYHERNTEEKNNGFVVLERNIHGSAGKWEERVREGSVTTRSPPLSTGGF